jgi:tryptophan halogenase
MNNIVILGGGSAGWLTALYIKKLYPNNNITVVEDPTKPPIIAGESGGVALSLIYKHLGINIADWVVKVNALPKLGGKFVDWNGIGTEFVHGLIDRTYDKDYSTSVPSFLGANREFISCALADNVPLTNIFYNSKLIKANKLPIVSTSNETFEAVDTIMWHFDSRANADYLKNIGLSNNITLVEGMYTSSQRAENGNITSIILDNSKYLPGDWFFDCSGFARLLLHKELGVELEDFTNLFPARSVLAWWNEDPQLINYTKITAMKYGWSWNINLHNRSGNGYVFDPDHITVDQAVEEAEIRFNTKITPVAKLNFVPSLVKEGWKNNVIAIGLSSGFLEPLESNGLSQIILQLELLERFWNPLSNTVIEKRMYNKNFNELMHEIINFLSLHYKGNRRDTDFWKSHAYDAFRTSDKLAQQLIGWKEGAFLEDIKHSQIYGLESYATVVDGLELLDREKLKHRLISKRADIFKDFNKSQNNLQKYIDHILNNSLSLEEWNHITYGIQDERI